MDRVLPAWLPARRVAVTLVLATMVAAILVGGAGHVLACTCAPSPPPETAMSEADAVFVGEVTALREEPSGTARVATLTVTEVFVGDVEAEVEVRTPADPAACGHGFERGRTDLVYAVLDADGVLNTGLCDRTAPLSAAEGDLAAFGEGTEPARDGVAAEDPADADDPLVPAEPEVLVTEVTADGEVDDGAGTGFRLAAVVLAIAAVIAITVFARRRQRGAPS